MLSLRAAASIAAATSLLWVGLPARVTGRVWTYRTLAGPLGSGYEDGVGASAGFDRPWGVAADALGNIYVADCGNSTLRKVTPSGNVSTLAGLAGYAGSVDGKGSAARFDCPHGIVVAPSGELFVTDLNAHTVRRVTPSGDVTTIAGVPGQSGFVDGTGNAARFSLPAGITVDGTGVLFVADAGNYRIRRVTVGGDVTTLAGSVPGWVDGTGAAANFSFPFGVAADVSGNLLVTDKYNQTIRKVTPSGDVTTVAGLVQNGGSTDGNGSAARFYNPEGIAIAPSGDFYITDNHNQTLRRMTPAYDVTTVAGSPGLSGYDDGVGALARFDSPGGVAVDGGGLVWIADTRNSLLRQVDAGASVATVAGRVGGRGHVDGRGPAARFDFSQGIALHPSGDLYYTEWSFSTIRRVTSGGDVVTIAGSPTDYGSADGTGAAARFDGPRGIVVNSVGDLFVADSYNATIRKVTTVGVVTTFAGTAGVHDHIDGVGPAAAFDYPWALAIDAADNLYVADAGDMTIRKVTPAAAVTTLAGRPWQEGHADGIGDVARFKWPIGIASDPDGTLHVVEESKGVVRRITPAGQVSTIAGVPWDLGVRDGLGSAARLALTYNLARLPGGDLVLFDATGLRRITPAGDVSTVAGGALLRYAVDASGRFASASSEALVADASGRLFFFDDIRSAIRVAEPGLDDTATIDAAVGPVGVLRQLDAQPRTAVTWDWTMVRRPAWSVAALSSTSIADPAFTPDVADRYEFRLSASGPAASAVTEVALETGCAVAINQPPLGSTTVCAGDPVTLTCTATGSPTLEYGWLYWSYFNWSSGTSPTITIDPAYDGPYRCMASNSCGSAASPMVWVNVTPKAGEVWRSLQLGKAGANISFQWRDQAQMTSYTVFEDAVASGPFLTTTGAAPSGYPGLTAPLPPGQLVFYRVAASNACGLGPK